MKYTTSLQKNFLFLVTITQKTNWLLFYGYLKCLPSYVMCEIRAQGVCGVMGSLKCGYRVLNPNSDLMSLSLTGVHSMTEVCFY